MVLYKLSFIASKLVCVYGIEHLYSLIYKKYGLTWRCILVNYSID